MNRRGGLFLVLGALLMVGASGFGVSGAVEEQLRVRDIVGQRPIGLLGKPVGERMVIEGIRAKPMMLMNPMAVEKVDGRVLPTVMNIEMRETDQMKKGVRYKVEGYESGGFEGSPEWLSPEVQQPFQYRVFFVVTKVIEPAGK